MSPGAQNGAEEFFVVDAAPEQGGVVAVEANLLDVLLAPLSIVTQPLSQVVAPGSSTTLSVEPSGNGPFTYQWLFNGTAIPDATNRTLLLTNITAAMAGSYSVRVREGMVVVESEPASITLSVPLLVLIAPSNQTVEAGSPFTLSVEAQGSGRLSYQWSRDGLAISNATNSSLTFANARFSDEGVYRVTIRDDNGVLTTEGALVDVLLANLPFRDHFADAVTVSGVYLAGRGSNTNATREEFEPVHDGQKAFRSVWLNWTAPANGVVSLTTIASDFDTVLAVYTGNELRSLTPVASSDDSEFDHGAEVKFNAVEGTTYRIAVAGYLFTHGSIRMELELTPALISIPMFLWEPRPVATAPGGDAYMDVGFVAQEAAQVDWIFMGTTINAVSSISNSMRNVSESMVGRYRVKITTPTHTLYSRFAEVQINSHGRSNVLAHDKLGGAADYGQFILPASPNGTAHAKSAKSGAGGSGSHGYTTTQIFSTAGATSDPGEPVHCGVGGGHSEWFMYQAETNGTLRIDTEGSSFDTVLAVYIGPGDSYATLTNVACDNNSGSNGLTSVVTFQATQGTIYWIAVDGVGGASGVVKLHINLGNPVSLNAQPLSQSVPSGTNVSFSVSASGMTNYTYQWRFGGTNMPGATNSTFTRTNVPAHLAGAYDVVVRNPINAVTSTVAMLTVYSASLNIHTQPLSQTVVAGTNVSLSVGASGAGVLRYQWRANGTNLPGATNSLLAIANVVPAHAGIYSVLVTDNNGSRLSSNATLTVLAPPVITLQPVSRTFGTGEVATLTASASGHPSPSLQWHFNGAPLAGQMSGTLTLNNFQSGNEGSYTLVASNAAGMASSASAELLLNVPLRLVNVTSGNGAFSARVVGVAGATFVVQGSSNFVAWTSLATNTASSGLWEFNAVNTNSPSVLFRVVVP